jgi:hypothetical protein
MTEFVMTLASLIPLDLPPQPPSPTPSALYPSRGPGRGAYFIGGFIGLGILMLAMTLLRLRPKRGDDWSHDQ